MFWNNFSFASRLGEVDIFVPLKALITRILRTKECLLFFLVVNEPAINVELLRGDVNIEGR
jgi:hypothetical protein